MIDDQFVEALLSAPDAQVRHALMREHGELMRVENVYALKERADRLERDDPHQAIKIGVLAEEVADFRDVLGVGRHRAIRHRQIFVADDRTTEPAQVVAVSKINQLQRLQLVDAAARLPREKVQ